MSYMCRIWNKECDACGQCQVNHREDEYDEEEQDDRDYDESSELV